MMMKTEPNDEAFNAAPNGHGFMGSRGLTKREYFAAKAMHGLISRPNNKTIDRKTMSDAMEIADALIDELNKHDAVEA